MKGGNTQILINTLLLFYIPRLEVCVRIEDSSSTSRTFVSRSRRTSISLDPPNAYTFEFPQLKPTTLTNIFNPTP